MKTTVINKQNAKKYFWGTHCESFVLLDTSGLSVKLEIMPPGSEEKMHFHNKSRQLFYILKGQASFRIEPEVIVVNANEGISIEPKQKHFIENKSPDFIEFLVISQPSTTEDRIEIPSN